MTELIEKLNRIKTKILSEKRSGHFIFFGIIERVDLVGKWDIVICADWITENNNESDLVYVIGEIKTEFDGSLDFLGRVLLMTSSQALIRSLARAIIKENVDDKELFNLRVGSIVISHLYIIESAFDDVDISAPPRVASPIAEVVNF